MDRHQASGPASPLCCLETTRIATSKSLYEEIKDRPTRKRTGNETTDLACKGRARLNNDKAKETIEQTFENCKVCGRSFKKGRGMNILVTHKLQIYIGKEKSQF